MVMYEVRKQENTKVSLSRKIHIMAFPQWTCLNTSWSDDQSAARVRRPAAAGGPWASVSVGAVAVIFGNLSG
jgi:hypothetical protein